MDETAYRQTLTSSIPRICPFEKTILTHCAACSNAEKHNIAEREVIACVNIDEHDRCIALLGLLRHNFTFALGKLHIDGPLPHAQEMRMQCGSLKSIRFLLDENDEVPDISELLRDALLRYGELAELPFSLIVQLANRFYKSR